MLDNPNLSLEKMLEVMASGISIVKYLLILTVILLIYLYRYEIKLLLKYGVSDESIGGKFLKTIGIKKTDFSKLEKRDLSDKVDAMLDKFNKSTVDFEINEQLSEDEVLLESDNDLGIPNFRSLKAIRNSNTIIYHFVNDGGAIHNFYITNSKGVSVSFNYKNRIGANASGFIKFKFPETFNKNKFNFTLVYYDEVNNLHQINYEYSLSNNKLRSTDRLLS